MNVPSEKETTRARGRPRTDDKRRRVLDAAMALMGQYGDDAEIIAVLRAAEYAAMGDAEGLAEWDRIIDVNLKGTFHVAKAAVTIMLDQPLVEGERGTVLSTLKHFPGHGDTTQDSHTDLPLVPHDRARLDSVELMPFRSVISAGVAGEAWAAAKQPKTNAAKMQAVRLPMVPIKCLKLDNNGGPVS